MIIGKLKKIDNSGPSGKWDIAIYTQGCIFHCPYCYAEKLIEINEGVVGENEAIKYLASNKNTISTVCITGGEPTLQYNLGFFIKKIKNMGMQIRLETSGINAKAIQNLIDNHLLDYISMDIKNSWEDYCKITKNNDKEVVKNCQESLRMIQASGIGHEYNTTVLPGTHNESNFIQIAGYLQKDEKYYIQNIQRHENFFQNENEIAPLDVKELVGKLRVLFPHLMIFERP